MANRNEKQWDHMRNNAQMRQVRKQIKRNRKTKRARHKTWMPDSWDNLDEWAVPQSEPVMPRGEQERRSEVLAVALEALREEQDESAATEVSTAHDTSMEVLDVAPGLVGTVIEVSSSLCRVKLNGRRLLCSTRGSLSAEDTGFTNVVAVGDRVVLSEENTGLDRGVVESVLPRKSVLARPDVFYSHLQQVIVANADQLLVVASWRDPVLWMELVDRYLIAAERHNLSPLICVNKIDLARDVAECRTKIGPYLDLGYPVLFTSATDGRGIEELRAVLKDRTTVLAGPSGVGKSSLLTAVQSDLQLRTGIVSDYGEGRHTTTQVNLIELEMGGFVVDTPGIREFGLSGLSKSELVRFYPEIAALQARCRFGDCSHSHEPGCAVKDAVQKNRISQDRYHSYRVIYDGLPG
ncbi:MAG: ribosome small subunit-dependent GTPase A [Anaerolineae bacterium]|nr:ribosome small subunit-dependent GTPase A [Anaerolineae bacterium]